MEETKEITHIVICETCRERLEYKPRYAKEHIEKYPDHQDYLIVLKEEEPIN